MAKDVRLISVGPGLQVQGGITRVVELIGANLPRNIVFRHVPTFTQYTGDADASERGSRLVQALVYLRALARIVGSAFRRHTIFHVHFAGRGSLIRKGLICCALRMLRCTYVIHSHVAETALFPSWLPGLSRRLLLWGLRGADRVIVLTQFWRDYYAGLLGVPAERILVLPNPADLPAELPDRSGHAGMRLLFLGRVGERKGAFDLIRAFAALPAEVRSGCTLTLAGDGEVQAAGLLATQLGCADRVRFTGWVGQQEVKRLLSGSDALLLPSRAEGMAMSLVEAMSWGLPVITTRAGGAQEFLEDGRDCILIDAGDVAAIGGAIERLYRDPARRLAMGRAARETISQFSVGTYANKLGALYQELVSAGPDRAATDLSRAGARGSEL